MSFDGSGTFTLAESAFVYDTVISETAVNSVLDDIATGLTACVTKTGVSTPTANLPMGNYKHTGVGAGTARTEYADVGSVGDGDYIWCGTAGGTADVITLTGGVTFTAYVTGMELRWKASGSVNTGAMTINLDSIGAKAAEINDAALAAGDHAANKYYRGIYDGTAFQIEQISGPAVASASTTVAGTVELATTAETETGTDTGRAVTPDSLHDMTTLSGAAWMLDEDDMSSDSATKVASQQSIKAYVDAAGGGLYTWKTNEAPSDNEQEHTSDTTISASATTQVESGPTVTLAAGDEIVLRIHELEVRCDAAAEADFTIGLHDGTTFFPMFSGDREYTANAPVVLVAPTNAGNPSVFRNNTFFSEVSSGSNDTAFSADGIFSFGILGGGSSKTYTLAVKNNDGANGVVVRGSSGTCKWSIGVRQEA